MTVYIMAHGAQAEGTVYVPQGQRLHFYAKEYENLLTKVGLKVLAAGGLEPVDTCQGGTVPNLRLTRRKDHERAAEIALTDARLTVRVVGDDLPDGILLCSRRGQADCAPEKLEAGGRHTCRGLLGRLASETEIFLLSCRLGPTEERQTYQHLDTLGLTGYFDTVDQFVEEFWKLTRTEPEKAWEYFQSLGASGTDYAKKLKDDPRYRDEAERERAIADQERAVMMLASNNKVRWWIDAYGATLLAGTDGDFSAYLQYLQQGAQAKEGWLEYAPLKKLVTRVKDLLDSLDELLKDNIADAEEQWNFFRPREREQALVIDDRYRDGLLVKHFAPGSSTRPTLDKVDWHSVAERGQSVLAELLVGELCWLVRMGERLLIESDDQHGVAGDTSHVSWLAYHALTADDDHTVARFECSGRDDDTITLKVVDVRGSLGEPVEVLLRALCPGREVRIELQPEDGDQYSESDSDECFDSDSEHEDDAPPADLIRLAAELGINGRELRDRLDEKMSSYLSGT